MPVMSREDYIYLYAKLEASKIPLDIEKKLDKGEELTKDEEIRIKKIIDEDKEKY